VNAAVNATPPKPKRRLALSRLTQGLSSLVRRETFELGKDRLKILIMMPLSERKEFEALRPSSLPEPGLEALG
jgi:hypothetical protein